MPRLFVTTVGALLAAIALFAATAFAQTAESQKEIYRALRDVPADELRLIPAVLEGRAELIPGATSPQLARALDVTKRNIRKHQQALMDRGLLTGDVVANRAYGPLVVTKTGKLIPEKDWTAARLYQRSHIAERVVSKKPYRL